jgi:hypothetical protein
MLERLDSEDDNGPWAIRGSAYSQVETEKLRLAKGKKKLRRALRPLVPSAEPFSAHAKTLLEI